MAKGSQKGSGFERSICKTLSLWWTKNKRDDIFWRTSGSGGRATVRMKHQATTADSAGDIMAISEGGKIFTRNFLVELKRGYSKQISVLSFIDSLDKLKKKPILFDWWMKAEKERLQHKRKWSIIIFKKDRKQICVFLSQEVFNFFVKLKQKRQIKHLLITIDKKHKFVIFPLNSFLKIVKIDKFKLAIQEGAK